MQQSPPTTTTLTPTSPADRSTEFRAVEGGAELRSGGLLLVQAYGALWLILFVSLWLGFRKQRQLDARISELEKTIAQAREGL